MLLHPVAFRLPVAFLSGIILAFGRLHERLHAGQEALVVLAFLKIRNDIVLADVFGLKIGDSPFEAIAHRDEELALPLVAGGLYEDHHTIIIFAAADSPVVEDLRGKRSFVHSVEVVHDHDADLVGSFLTEIAERPLKALLLLLR